jgi:glycosyltransferase involved in cell wall biosynthesis
MRNNKEIIKIGLDGRPFSSRISGVARVISNIITEFPHPERFQFIIYSHKAIHPDFYYLKNYPNVQFVTGQGLTARFGGLWFNLTLPRIVKKNKIDIFWGSQQVIPPRLPRSLPVVLTYYDLVLYRFPGSMRFAARMQQLAVQEMSVKRADRILTISSQTRTDLIQKFDYPEDQVEVALLGYTPLSLPGAHAVADNRDKKTPDQKIKSSGKKNIKEQERLFSPLSFNDPFILTVSTIEPRKNYPMLIDAYVKYIKTSKEHGESPYPLVIAGRRGWESAEFFEKLDELSASTGLIHLMDNLSDSELAFLYKDAAFFCLPSLYEGFGLTLLEALAEGKYALASDIGPFHEIGGDLIRYIDPSDSDAWSEAISETVHLHKTRKLRKISFPVKNWTWKNTAQKHYEAFMSFLPAARN